MKTLIRLFLGSSLLLLPIHAGAQPKAEANGADSAKCITAADTSAMQKNMGAMMTDLDGMMHSSDPAMRAHMQKMRDQMATMMADMKTMNGSVMHSGMMRGAMMPTKENPGSGSSAAPAAPAAEDHTAHHPKQ